MVATYRQRLARVAGRPIPDHVHGTINGYRYWRCRCKPCTDAERAYQRDWYQRRKHRWRA